jgi:hypothetical protein
MAPGQESAAQSLIFAMLVQAAMVIWAIADIKKDVEVLKAAMVQQIDRDNRQDRATADAVGLVREDLREVKSMLQKLLERNGAYK